MARLMIINVLWRSIAHVCLDVLFLFFITLQRYEIPANYANFFAIIFAKNCSFFQGFYKVLKVLITSSSAWCYFKRRLMLFQAKYRNTESRKVDILHFWARGISKKETFIVAVILLIIVNTIIINYILLLL